MKLYRRFRKDVWEIGIGRDPALFDESAYVLPEEGDGASGAVNAFNKATQQQELVGYFFPFSKVPGYNDRLFEDCKNLERPEDAAALQKLMAAAS